MTTVLVSDDEPDICALVEIVLGRAGYRVHTATDGDEAVEMIMSLDLDLVLLDLRMPHFDGFAVLAGLPTREVLDHIRVFPMSAHADDGLIGRAISEGCRGYVRKPFHPDALVETVRDALTR
jgi:CheY-like chemotaxis protein